MREKNPVYLIILTLFSGILACNLLDLGTSSGPETLTEPVIESPSQDEPVPDTPGPVPENQQPEEDTGSNAQPVSIDPGARIQPTDLMYLGAFRLPDPSDGSSWDYSGRGPGLFAYAPWRDGNPPEPNATLTTLVPLLLYGIQEDGIPDIVSDESMAMNGYKDSDHWMGGAWLTTADKGAVIFVGTKALGEAWYGFANGLVWPHDCAENNACPDPPEWPYDNRGFWADDYEAQMIFYDPAELAAVAAGQMETWEPQPYAVMSIEPVLYDPDINLAEYRRDLLAAAAFDRANGFLYVIERLADEYKSVVHVWGLQAE
jgi:hypothetical protein